MNSIHSKKSDRSVNPFAKNPYNLFIVSHLPGGRSPSDHRNRFNTYEPDIPAIACGVAAAIIIVTLIYACFLYYRQRSTPDENYYTSFQQRQNSAARADEQKNPDLGLGEPIYEQIAPTNVYNSHAETNGGSRPADRIDGVRGIDGELRYHVPEIECRSTTTERRVPTASSDAVRENTAVMHTTDTLDPSGQSGVGTIASAPPLSDFYVSMDRLSGDCYNDVSQATSSHIEPTERNNLL